MDKRRLVQQYVERQKTYLPTYTTERLWNERHGTPPKLLQSGDFGFDTPVLLPRVPVKTCHFERTQKAGPSKSREAELAHSSLDPPPAAADSREALNKDKARPKRKKGSTSNDTESERAARLADRRERKRKKRAIVNPLQKHTPATAAPQKGKTNSQKAKKPAALALLYGFSATNVTKDRLTLRPAPSLGVFSKGRASAKKQVTAVKRTSSRKEVFSECAFLNKPSEQAADHSKVDDDSDDSSVSSISHEPMPRVAHLTNRTRKNRDKCAKTTGSKPLPQAPTRAIAESEIWDIELQSKLPSTAGDVSSEPEGNDSAPVVVDLRGAEWTVVEEHEERCNKTWSRSVSDTRSLGREDCVRKSPLAIPDLYAEIGQAQVAGAPSIHPSHSASQVGRRVGDMEPPQVGQMTSKYFPDAVELVANDGVEFRANSLISVAQPVLGFETGYYDVEPLFFPSDDIDEQVVDDDDGCAEDDAIYDTSFLDPSVSDEMEPVGLLSGLAQAEMDVAGQLRNHWRPQRLS